MTNRKISDFTALTAPASTDTLPIIDQSETGTEKNKKITYANLLSKAPDGSASAPSFSFSSDPNTGISGGSDTLTLSTGGSGRLTISSAGVITIPGDLTVSGTTTTINTTNLDVEDKNITLGKVSSPSDTTADGGGLTLKGATDKTFNWVDSTDSWTSSEHIDLASGKVLKVAGTEVLSATNFTGTSAIATNVTVADESSDTTCNVLFTTAATGNLPPKTGTNLTFNSSTGALTATSFVGTVTVPDDSVTSDKIVDGAIVNADVNASAAIAGTKISPDFGSQNIVTTGDFNSGSVTITGGSPAITFTDSNNDPDYYIQNNNGALRIFDATNSAERFVVNTDGHVDILGNLDVGAGIDVTGTITSTDNIEIDNAKAIRLYEADSNGSAYVGIKGATDKGSEASYTVSLPAAAPTANQILKANASTPTNLEWVTDTGGNSTSSTIADESTDTTCFPWFATAATGDLGLKSGSNLTFNSANGTLGATIFSGSGASLTNLPSSALTGALPAIDGSALTGISAGATGGGSDEVFVETGQTVTTSYTLSTNKNAVTVSPTINNGVVITVPTGATLVIL